MNNQRIPWRLLGLAGFALAAGLLCLYLSPARPDVTLTTMARLSPGMLEADVRAILGPETADLTARPPAGVPAPAAGGRLLEYAGTRATARVEYGPDGRMVRCHTAVRVVTGLERLRIRLNWW
jgi:hypothetical protein